MKLIIVLLFTFIVSGAYSQEEKKTSVLFIGNSFTFQNDMPVIFKEISESLNKPVDIDTVVQGGMDIKYHSQQELTFSKIEERKWDYVVIQGHSVEFAKYDDEIIKNTLPYLKQILESVKSNHSKTKILMYMTWGYKNGNEGWDEIDSYSKMQDLIQKQYLRTAEYLSVAVSPVGAVWREVRNRKRRINLYALDKYHPSRNGSFLSACTFYASIFGESPSGSKVSLRIRRRKKSNIEKIATEIVLGDRKKWMQE